MRKTSERLTPVAVILISGLLMGCVSKRDVGAVVAARCPAPTPIPASLQTMPPEAQINYEDLILKALGL